MKTSNPNLNSMTAERKADYLQGYACGFKGGLWNGVLPDHSAKGLADGRWDRSEADRIDLRKHVTEERVHDYPPEKAGLYIKLLHGRDHPLVDMEDWGFEGPWVGPIKAMHCTYNATWNLCFFGGDESGPEADPTLDDMLVFDGALYGDWEFVYIAGKTNDANMIRRRRLQLLVKRVEEMAAKLDDSQAELHELYSEFTSELNHIED